MPFDVAIAETEKSRLNRIRHLRAATILIIAHVVAASAAAQAQETPAAIENRPIALFGARYAVPTRWTGGLGLLVPIGNPSKNGDLGDLEAHRGLEIAASAGVGGGRLAVGAATVGKPPRGPVLFVGDLLFGLTRTWNSPRGISADSTCVEIEGGVTLLMVRLSAGLLHRVAGSDATNSTIFTWSVGVQTGW